MAEKKSPTQVPGCAPDPQFVDIRCDPAYERSILMNFVLDKSGSMEPLRQVTIAGFNEFKNDQARAAGSARMTLTLFDTDLNTVATAVPVGDVRDLSRDTSTTRPHLKGAKATMARASRNVRAHRKFAEAQAPEWFSPGFEVMADLEGVALAQQKAIYVRETGSK